MRWFLTIVIVGLAAGCGSPRGKDSKSTNSSANSSQNNTGASCGNGVVDSGELCDPGIEGAGACPTECRAPACNSATLSGVPAMCDAQCKVEPVDCIDGDGCCTLGCDATNDDNCTNICGNGLVEDNELCDGDCPTACGTPTACSTVQLVGDPARCSARCEVHLVEFCQGGDGCCPPNCNANNDADCGASCGNGTLEPGESCDGDCPTNCSDGVECTRDTRAGSPETCNVICINDEIRVCASGDGCCPTGCSAATDADCSSTCGNGSLDPGETCDGNCPASCADGNGCTRDTRRGSDQNCNVECVYEPVNFCQGGDGCCPAGCTSANDSDCQCAPDTCASLGVQCGPAPNGCGGTIQCGTCASGPCDQGMCDGGMSGVIGTACSSDADCPDMVNTTPTCLLPSQGYPGGYCSASCMFICNDFVSACIGTAGLPIVGLCHAACQSSSDCRSGYSCQSVDTGLGVMNACLPN